MDTNSNVELIKKLYASFSKGDIETIIGALDEDVLWEQPNHPEIPYGGSRRGKAAVKDFFQNVAQVQVANFEPQEFVASGDRVLAIGRWSGQARPTGKSFKSEWIMSWIVRNGKVKYFRSYEDTAAVVAAFRK
jgi:ketosteroid isomerase-like protein